MTVSNFGEFADPARCYPTLGIELEMAVIDRAGRSACVDGHYFDELAALKRMVGPVSTQYGDGRAVGVTTADGVNGIDNAFNLLESALAPETAGPETLRNLSDRMNRDLASVLKALQESGDLTVTSLAQHPTVGIGEEWYQKARAPKSIYRYLVEQRGWTHAIGVDAKAQNGPTTGLTADTAVDALNMLLAASPAFIALFANSPFESGRRAATKETRMTLWPRMVATSRVAADRDRVGLPPRPFNSIGDYVQWMFAEGTVMQAIPAHNGGYKDNGALYVAGSDRLTVGRFFGGGPWPASPVGGGAEIMITPRPGHFTFLQWSNFLDFRLRFNFEPDRPTTESLRRAFQTPDAFNEIFASWANNLYVENRCAGATFVDDDLSEQAPGDVAASAMVSVAALQAGLVAAAPASCRLFLEKWPWQTIRELREAAIRDALSGDQAAILRRFVADVLRIAGDHVPTRDQWALAYPNWVLDTGLTGADRAIAQADRLRLEGPDGLERLASLRVARVPPDPPTSTRRLDRQ